MTRWLVPGAFLAAAIPMGVNAASALEDAWSQPALRTALIGCYFLLRAGVGLAFAVFTMRRAEPRRRSRGVAALVACAVAMLAMLAFGAPDRTTASGLVLVGDAVAVLACVWLLVSVLALGRCFGVLPEARGLVMRGPYRLVRHPVYLGELGACLGLTIASPSARNAALLGVFAAAQAARMRLEEAALAAAFPEYGAYAARTRRLVPRLGVLSAPGVAGGARMLPGRLHLAKLARAALGEPTRPA